MGIKCWIGIPLSPLYCKFGINLHPLAIQKISYPGLLKGPKNETKKCYSPCEVQELSILNESHGFKNVCKYFRHFQAIIELDGEKTRQNYWQGEPN